MAQGRGRSGGKSPAAVLADVERRLGAGYPPGLTVLTGDDLYHLDQAQRLLLAALVPADATAFGLTVYSEGKVEVSAVVAAARSVGMFTPRRVVFVRDVTVLDGEPDALVAFAKSPPPASHIVVRAVQLDQRFKLHKALAQLGHLFRFEQAGQEHGAILLELKTLAQRKKVKLSREALDWVAEACGGDIYRATNELDKLAAWGVTTGEASEPIPLEAAQALVRGNERLDGWEVSDALVGRDRAEALVSLRALLAAGVEPLKLLGGIAWRARAMLAAKALLARRTPEREVVRASGAWGFGDRLLAGLRRYSLEELLAFPDLLRTADLALKGGLVPAADVLEDLVERMTGNPGGPGHRGGEHGGGPVLRNAERAGG